MTNNNDKIPIGKYILPVLAEPSKGYIVVVLKDPINIKKGDIVTLDMIEPYESEAVRKVAEYIHDYTNHSGTTFTEYAKEYWINHAREIVKIVHESEDSDE